ncbi:hypothetical protein J2X19_002474 [Rhodoferax ferrireducens]|uniref:WYL domain-containing protein n=1 Tax=Rhodoferax ferrireducens TaxID=192843 RepID=A0ABU2C8X8_9BURK|nr:hypothetical protein [Rhodoferax ferrireducens]MDR7377795.1 hypothetical protein [Rhodoferax ferrireducens]
MDESPWQGFLVAESDCFVVLHRVGDRFDLDGYCAFRRIDIVSIAESFEKQDLIQRALRLNGQDPMIPKRIDCTSTRSLMESAQEEFGVLVIEREKVQPDEVQVGTIRMTSEDTYVLRWLSVNAEWENDDRPFRYKDITKLEFGAGYEQTLLAVARSRERDG